MDFGAIGAHKVVAVQTLTLNGKNQTEFSVFMYYLEVTWTKNLKKNSLD